MKKSVPNIRLDKTSIINNKIGDNFYYKQLFNR